jgi:hypothetical protein
MTKTIQPQFFPFLSEADEETQDNTSPMLSVLGSLNDLQKSINKLAYQTEKILLEKGLNQYVWRKTDQNPGWR